MKRIFGTATALLLSAVLMTGCGRNREESSDYSSNETTTSYTDTSNGGVMDDLEDAGENIVTDVSDAADSIGDDLQDAVGNDTTEHTDNSKQRTETTTTKHS